MEIIKTGRGKKKKAERYSWGGLISTWISLERTSKTPHLWSSKHRSLPSAQDYCRARLTRLELHTVIFSHFNSQRNRGKREKCTWTAILIASNLQRFCQTPIKSPHSYLPCQSKTQSNSSVWRGWRRWWMHIPQWVAGTRYCQLPKKSPTNHSWNTLVREFCSHHGSAGCSPASATGKALGAVASPWCSSITDQKT